MWSYKFSGCHACGCSRGPLQSNCLKQDFNPINEVILKMECLQVSNDPDANLREIKPGKLTKPPQWGALCLTVCRQKQEVEAKSHWPADTAVVKITPIHWYSWGIFCYRGENITKPGNRSAHCRFNTLAGYRWVSKCRCLKRFLCLCALHAAFRCGQKKAMWNELSESKMVVMFLKKNKNIDTFMDKEHISDYS